MGHLVTLQAELDAAHPDAAIRLLLVNEYGYEAESDLAIAAAGPLPYLQDPEFGGAWELWRPLYRDVVVLDPQNRKVHVFNLTDFDLEDPTYYGALRTLLLDAAGL